MNRDASKSLIVLILIPHSLSNARNFRLYRRDVPDANGNVCDEDDDGEKRGKAKKSLRPMTTSMSHKETLERL